MPANIMPVILAVGTACAVWALAVLLETGRRPQAKGRLPSKAPDASLKKTLLLAAAGAAGGALLSYGAQHLIVMTGIGAGLGTGAGVLFEQVAGSRRKFVRLREAAILYESVDHLARAGFTVRQSLQMSLPLLTVLRPVVGRCLDRWPTGSLRALAQMGEDINVPEADVLISVLMHAEEMGTERIAGIMEEEAFRLEELRKSLAESRIVARPLQLTIYVFLPVVAVLGTLLAPLAYRAISMITSIKVGF